MRRRGGTRNWDSQAGQKDIPCGAMASACPRRKAGQGLLRDWQVGGEKLHSASLGFDILIKIRTLPNETGKVAPKF